MFDCHPKIEQMKADFLDFLYEQSGREELPYGHPLRSTYTGLWEEFKQHSAQEARRAWWEVQQLDSFAFDR